MYLNAAAKFRVRGFGFVAMGSSTPRLAASQADEMLVDGFGRDPLR